MKKIIMVCLLAILFLSSCASLQRDYQAPELSLVDLKMLSSTGFEQQFELKLRLQNPNDLEVPIKGMSYDLFLLGNKFASGVSNDVFTLEPFSEELVTFKVRTNLLQAGRTLMKLFEGKQSVVDYSMKAKIHTDKFLLGTIPVVKSGKLELNGLLEK